MPEWHFALAAGRAAFMPVNSPLSVSIGRQPSLATQVEARRASRDHCPSGLELDGGMDREKERERKCQGEAARRLSDFWVSKELQRLIAQQSSVITHILIYYNEKGWGFLFHLPFLEVTNESRFSVLMYQCPKGNEYSYQFIIFLFFFSYKS